MMATNHTEHYGLSQYAQDDRPTYTGDYNGDMSKIDAAIYALASRIAVLESRVSALTPAVTPGVTTLTATQLDPRYLDDYNSIRARKPTGSIESEEPHHE